MKLNFIFTLAIIFSISLAAAVTVNSNSIYDNTGVNIIPPTAAINYSEIGVNDSLLWDGNAWSDTRWLNIDGSNAISTVDIGVNFFAGEGTMMYEYLDQSGSNQLFGWDVAGLSREDKWSSPNPFKILNTVEIYDSSNNPVLIANTSVDVGLSSMTSTNPYLRISGYDSAAKVAKTGFMWVDAAGAFNIRSATGETLSLSANGASSTYSVTSGGFYSLGPGGIHAFADNQPITMGAAGATDYSQTFDGTDAQFYTSGDYLFTGGNLAIDSQRYMGSTFSTLSQRYSSAGLVLGYNAIADTANNNQMIIKNTNGAVGAGAIAMDFTDGITFHTVAGAVTAGDVFDAERMKIDTSGNVLMKVASSGATASTSYDNLVIESNDTSGMTFLTPNNKASLFAFGDSESSTAGFLQYSHTTDDMYIKASDNIILDGDGVMIGSGTPATPLQVDQKADNLGIRVRGFDNENDEYLNMYVDDFGIVNVQATNLMKFYGTTGTYMPTGYMQYYDNIQIQMGTAGATDYYQTFDGTDAQFYTSGDFVFNGTNFGIGNTNPLYPLHVTGNIVSNTGAFYGKMGVSGSAFDFGAISNIQTRFIQNNTVRMFLDASGDTNVVNNLNVGGSLNQTNGNATINMIYAEGWGMDIGEVAIASAGVYYNVTNFTEGLVNGFTFNADGGVTPDVGGVYKITGSWSFSGAANTEYHIAVAKNNVVQNNCHAERVIGTGADVGSATITCFVTLAIGDTLNSQIENVDSTANPTIHNINFNVLRIGN